jgi:hypothetical protein
MGNRRINVRSTVKRKVDGRQFYKCANSPENNVKGLGGYKCPMWLRNMDKGSFDENGCEIDHKIEYCITQDNSINNLQALCRACHKVKTKLFNKSRQKERCLDESSNSDSCSDLDESSDSDESSNSDSDIDFKRLIGPNNVGESKILDELKHYTSQFDLKDHITEKIDDVYSHATYGSLDIIIMNKNSYVNATQLCHAFNKRFKNWTDNKAKKELLNKLSNLPGIKQKNLTAHYRSNLKPYLRGTYVHPALLPHIIMWATCNYSFACAIVYNKYLKLKEDVKEL